MLRRQRGRRCHGQARRDGRRRRDRLRLLVHLVRRALRALLAHQLVVEAELGLRLRALPLGRRRGGDGQTHHLLLDLQALRLRALPDVEAEQVDEAAGRDPGEEEDKRISTPETAAPIYNPPAYFNITS